jgi:hypothetical protein
MAGWVSCRRICRHLLWPCLRLVELFSRGHKGHSTAPCNNTVAFTTPYLVAHVAYVGGQCLPLWSAGQLQLAVCLVVGLNSNMLLVGNPTRLDGAAGLAAVVWTPSIVQ